MGHEWGSGSWGRGSDPLSTSHGFGSAVFLVGPEQSPAAKQMSSALLPESCFTRFVCTCDSAKYGVAKLSLWGIVPNASHWLRA